MKFTIAIFTFFATAAFVKTNPISVSNNNVGDIVTVGVNANAVLTSSIETNIVTALIALLNQQAALINADLLQAEQVPEMLTEIKEFDMSPESIAEKIKNSKITPELIETVKKILNKE
ncbi:hypothetical protein PVAND_010762 [Polypedilum vanderplanki]|uniref:Uncharacterized protein n=1 Tax=Polypedilum vanderplanki TaxID=319348 RepID=A0A9J6CGK4_POLVA|nr:hypothetical protein PVAND_010762 [Polypedilum vanderplanki]